MTDWEAWLVRAITIGIQHCKGKTEERKLIQCNAGVYVAMSTIAAFNLAFIINGNLGLIYSGLVQLPYLLLMPSVLWLNHRGLRYQATILLFILVTADALTALTMAQGVSIGLHYYFVLFAILPASFFDAHRWLTSISVSVFNLLLFSYFENFGWHAHPAVAEIPELVLNPLRILMIGSCVVTILLLILISEYYSTANERQLQHLADTDGLTGLPNRRAFIERLEHAIKESRPFCLLIIDVDYFKRINDSHGHLAGDKALKFIANELKLHMRSNELIGRIGGEEFAMVLYTPSPADNVLRTEKVCNDIAAKSLELNKKRVTLTVSIGACQVKPPANSLNILTLADAALYEAKSRGRNRVEVVKSFCSR